MKNLCFYQLFEKIRSVTTMAANETKMEDYVVVAEFANVANANATSAKVVESIQVPTANALSVNVENLQMTKFVPELGIVSATNVFVLLHIQVISYTK